MDKEQLDTIGDNHISSNIETPLMPDAFDKTDQEKIRSIQGHFEKIMRDLGLDLTDESLSGTP